MAVTPDTVDLTHIEDVTDVKPEPTIAVSETRHHIGSIGASNKRILLDLLDKTDESEPFGARVFDRLGVGYSHTTWDGFDLFWVDDEDAFENALRTWHSAQEME